MGLLNARNYNFGGEFVEAMIRQLKECLKVNMYNEAVHLVSGVLFVYLFHILFLSSFHPFVLEELDLAMCVAVSCHLYSAVHCKYSKKCVLCEKYFLLQGRGVILHLQNLLPTIYFSQ